MRKGSHCTPEQKKRMSDAKKGRKGWSPTEEVRRKISEATRGVKKTITSPNPSWFQKGNKSPTPFKKGMVPWNKGKLIGSGRASQRYKLWQTQVLERDGKKCRRCGAMNNLHVHHILPWKTHEALRFDVSNGRTLCLTCHSTEEGTLKKLGNIGRCHRFVKGHVHSKETREKLSQGQKGKPGRRTGKLHSEETKQKMRLAKQGYIPWNKGLHKKEEKNRTCRICGVVKNIGAFPSRHGQHGRMCKQCRNQKLMAERRSRQPNNRLTNLGKIYGDK